MTGLPIQDRGFGLEAISQILSPMEGTEQGRGAGYPQWGSLALQSQGVI